MTPVLSKVAEEYAVEYFLKPAVLKKADLHQFGTLPGLNTTDAHITMLHKWKGDTDGNSATVRIVLSIIIFLFRNWYLTKFQIMLSIG